jgi:hypothetical protein
MISILRLWLKRSTFMLKLHFLQIDSNIQAAYPYELRIIGWYEHIGLAIFTAAKWWRGVEGNEPIIESEVSQWWLELQQGSM